MAFYFFRKNALLTLVLSIFFATTSFSQKKEVLFTVNEKPYFTDEFSRIYKKNIDLVKDESQKDLTKYLDLFIGYKLKVNKALKLGLDKNDKYIAELKSNRTQLAKNYLTDSKVTQELIDEAYGRLQKEIRASHILIAVDENAAPADSLVAYNKILDIRKKAISGTDFGILAQENSSDTSAKENKGDLGYFSAFRMVYPFENGAFKTQKDQISMPVRTRFGYHLIKVVDIRANRGEMSAAHIMITKATDPSKETETKTKIDDIYKKIQQGESFESLATQFSDDKSSSDKGGVLNRFGSGQLNSEEFESVAFGLSKINPMSKPFQSAYGWHIVKFIEKFPVRTAKEMQQELNTKISKDERSRKIAASINNSLRKEYKLTVDAAVYTDILETVTADYTAGTWKLPENIIILEKSIVTIGAKKISTKQFLTYLNEQQRSYKDSKLSLKTIVDKNLEKFSDEQLNLFADENLENKFPEFANVVEEYRDGLLLFDLMEKEIWEKAKNDSTGLKTFFNKNKENYKWKKRLDVSIASSLKKEVTEQALSMLKAGRSAAEIKKAINTEQSVNVIFSEGVFEEGNSVLQKNVTFKTGVSDIIQNKEYYYITKVNKLLPDNFKTFDESKGKVINDYQQYLEKNWVTELKREFVVKVNQDIFEKIRAQIQK